MRQVVAVKKDNARLRQECDRLEKENAGLTQEVSRRNPTLAALRLAHRYSPAERRLQTLQSHDSIPV
jgi:hypothetical protein